MRTIFVQTLHIFLIVFQKRSIKLFTVPEIAKRRHGFFSSFGPETEKQINLGKYKICFDL